MSVELDAMYDAVAQRCGITRVRDYRLEAIAQDRALEGRYQVGLDCVEPCEMPHPIPQLKARTFPIQGTFKGVWENTFWTYRVEDQANPYDAALEAWWASPAHHANLVNGDATSIGLGAYFEDKPGASNRRWYFVAIFTKDLLPDPNIGPVLLRAGTHRGYKYHDDGSVAQKKAITRTTDRRVKADGFAVINGVAHVHMATSALEGFWVPRDGHLVEP